MKELTQPLNQIIGVVFVWVATVLSNAKNLASKNSITVGSRTVSEKAIGVGLIAVSTAGLAFQVWKSYSEYAEVHRLNQIIEDSSSILFNEASGGAVIKDLAYIVDDEKPRLFKLRLRVPEKGYEYTGDEVKLSDNVDDLEALASKPNDKAPETLYLITSHSNTKKGEAPAARQKLLEVSLASGSEGRITKSQEKLRASIGNIFNKLSNELHDENLTKLAAELKLAKGEEGKGIIQIEGLAVDEDDYAYIGFRSPLVQRQGVKYALVLRARLSDLFSHTPEFQPFLLNLYSDSDNDSWGISSIDYDTQTKTLLLIGNDPLEQRNKPRLWQWYFSGETALIQNPTDRGLIYYSSSSARPELLLLPSKSVSDRIYTFLDTDGKGKGGQTVLERRKFSLEAK